MSPLAAHRGPYRRRDPGRRIAGSREADQAYTSSPLEPTALGLARHIPAMFEMGQCFLCHSAWVSAPSAAAPSGVVTFLFTDVEGSTRRWEADADGMRAALAAHDQVLRQAIEPHGGFLFKHTGDGVCAAFSSPKAAVAAAIAA